MRAATLISLVFVAAAGGCASPLDAPLSPTFGAAVASLEAQIIPPTAATEQPPQGSGARGVAAIRRYERGEPKTAGESATSNVSAMIGKGSGGSTSSIDK
jgi:hypothetical protein